jgi:hypothetical protein
MRRIIGFVLIASSLIVAKRLFHRPIVTASELRTPAGDTLTLIDPTRPTAVGFVIQPCGYSDRVLRALHELREKHSEDELNVVALYLNPVDDGTLKRMSETHGIPVVAAQPRIAQLQRDFSIRGAGVDVYVVAPSTGRIRSVDYSQKAGDSAAGLAQVEALLAER